MIMSFDNTMLSYFKTCPRKFYFRMVLNLELPADNFDTDYKAQFGVAWHLAMDEWFTNGSVEKMESAFITHWLPFDGQDPKGQRTLLTGLELMRMYRARYPQSEEPFKVRHCEIGFSAPLGKYMYNGRMDKVLEWLYAGYEGLVVMDHKTSTAKGFLNPKPNSALTGYIWGVMATVNEPVVGAYLDEVYCYKQLVPSKCFIRELTVRSEREMEEWELDTLTWMDAVNTCNDNKVWPINSDNCRKFGRDCEYILLCNAGSQDERDALIGTMYKENEWKPYMDARDK